MTLPYTGSLHTQRGKSFFFLRSGLEISEQLIIDIYIFQLCSAVKLLVLSLSLGASLEQIRNFFGNGMLLL